MFIPCTYKYVIVHLRLYIYVIPVHVMYIDRNLHICMSHCHSTWYRHICTSSNSQHYFDSIQPVNHCWIIVICITPVHRVVLLHWIPSKTTISFLTWYIQVHTRIYSVQTLYVLACTLFTTTPHFPSGQISLATSASLSSAQEPLLLSSLRVLPVTSLFNWQYIHTWTLYIPCIYILCTCM